MKTLLLSNRFSPDSIALDKAARELGWETARLHKWQIDSGQAFENPIPYGEILFVQYLVSQLKLNMIVPPPDLLEKLTPKYTKRNVYLTTFGEARKLTKRAFIKPAADKTFRAGTYDIGDDICTDYLYVPDEVLTLVSEPVEWLYEFRSFIRNRKLCALSIYIRNGVLAFNENNGWRYTDEEYNAAKEFIESLLADTSIYLPDAFVLDVGLMKDRGWGVVEANEALCSGLCGHNPADVLPVLEACIV